MQPATSDVWDAGAMSKTLKFNQPLFSVAVWVLCTDLCADRRPTEGPRAGHRWPTAPATMPSSGGVLQKHPTVRILRQLLWPEEGILRVLPRRGDALDQIHGWTYPFLFTHTAATLSFQLSATALPLPSPPPAFPTPLPLHNPLILFLFAPLRPAVGLPCNFWGILLTPHSYLISLGWERVFFLKGSGDRSRPPLGSRAGKATSC